MIKTILASGQAGDQIKVSGWVRSRRDSKAGLSFIALTDGSCFDSLQVIAPTSLSNYDSEVLRLTKDCALEIEGTLVASLGQGQAIELKADQITVLGWVEDPETYPISPKRHSMEHLREHLHLRVRTNVISAISRVRHAAAFAIHEFLNQEGFFWVNTPIITTNDCEGAGELFRISTLEQANHFFGKEAFLTVSGQLNVECYAMALSKVYTFGPAFRAENSNTSRHLAEFWMIEPEIAFADLMADIDLAEKMLKYIIQQVLSRCADDMAFFNTWVDKTCLARLEHVCNTPFVRMDYSEAISLLLKADQTFTFPVAWGIDLQSEHERYLCEHVVKGPLVLMNYPKDIKAFYMRLNDDDKTVAAMDVLVPGIGELIGGSQREERLHVLDQRLHECGLDPAAYQWYRDLRRYGTTAHAGFGLGFERLLSYLTGIANIRDVIPFPRVPGFAVG